MKDRLSLQNTFISRPLTIFLWPHEGMSVFKCPVITEVMENHIKLTSGLHTNSYLRQFQVAQLNFYLFLQEEKSNKKKYRLKHALAKADEAR